MRLAGHYRAVGRMGAGCSGFALFRKSAVLGLGLGFVAVSCFALLCLALSTASSVYAAYRAFSFCKPHGYCLRQILRPQLVRLRVGGFQLVAGCKHGQPRNHAIHIKAVGRTGSSFYARLGQAGAFIKCQRYKLCARRV